ncbi:hypothetical protein [Polyangium aurulentum]|uniref:hypothetical protein n=1 Tax=Polyangium aurulentum TaxID=2567896 RepID=UPI0010ADBF76|nr:hypothetical protein [Polyangium aurulentum]UQA56220.1 hypothetical protein E8A73_033615 [Polyangium aurulentum]
MAKMILGFGALVLYGSLGMGAGTFDVDTEASPLGSMLPESMPAEARSQAATVPGVTGSDAGRSTIKQDMSDEEKDRRRDECATLYEHCYDWCGKSTKPGSKARSECNRDCMQKLEECMKKIR